MANCVYITWELFVQ